LNKDFTCSKKKISSRTDSVIVIPWIPPALIMRVIAVIRRRGRRRRRRRRRIKIIGAVPGTSLPLPGDPQNYLLGR
jgi:hypothetical protein